MIRLIPRNCKIDTIHPPQPPHFQFNVLHLYAQPVLSESVFFMAYKGMPSHSFRSKVLDVHDFKKYIGSLYGLVYMYGHMHTRLVIFYIFR